MKKIFLNIILFLLFVESTAQQKYWIYFKDKTVFETNKSFTDQPLDVNYISYLESENIRIISKSKWLNAVSSILDDNQIDELLNEHFISKIEPINANIKLFGNVANLNLSTALEQIEAGTFITNGLTGQDILIGVIDGGFYNADKHDQLKALISNNQIVGYKNFIERNLTDPFSGPKKFSDSHGTNVLKFIGGKDDSEQLGLATEAKYYLARTDQRDKEHRGEEDYWIEALEWMYDHGVRLVNSSLGYSDGYDDPRENYTQKDIDGISSAITQAATVAVEEKGMILVIAAGNEGNNRFKLITKPADSPGVIAVGATGLSRWEKASYSSIGPERMNEIKPEIAVYSPLGTSYATPIITGLLACLKQAKPEASNDQIIEALFKSCHLYNSPNNYIGYGVPSVPKLLKWIESDQIEANPVTEIKADADSVTLNIQDINIVAFHKSSVIHVISQQILKPDQGIVLIKKREKCLMTTVATTTKAYEIFWP